MLFIHTPNYFYKFKAETKASPQSLGNNTMKKLIPSNMVLKRSYRTPCNGPPTAMITNEINVSYKDGLRMYISMVQG